MRSGSSGDPTRGDFISSVDAAMEASRQRSGVRVRKSIAALLAVGVAAVVGALIMTGGSERAAPQEWAFPSLAERRNRVLTQGAAAEVCLREVEGRSDTSPLSGHAEQHATVTPLTDDSFLVKSYADVQYAQPVRVHFTCEVSLRGEDWAAPSSWSVRRLMMR
jgi:hypothetical protein